MTALLTSQAEDQEDTIANLNECKRMGIKVLPVDINKSGKGYTIETYQDEEGNEQLAIRIGLLSIKGIGESVVNEILEKREEGGPFVSLEDFINRVSGRAVNKNSVETLILAGAFDSLESNRYRLLNHYFFDIRGAKPYPGGLKEYEKAKKAKDKNKRPKADEYPMLDEESFTDELRWEYEKQFFGMSISGHPLEGLPYRPWSTIRDNEPLKIGGRILSVREHRTKGKGKLMAFFRLETQAETLDCTIFPKEYEKYAERIFEGNVVIVKGKKQVQYNGREGILVEKVLLAPKKYRVSV